MMFKFYLLLCFLSLTVAAEESDYLFSSNGSSTTESTTVHGDVVQNDETLQADAVQDSSVSGDICSLAAAKATIKSLKPFLKTAPSPAPQVDDGISRVNCPGDYYVGRCTANLEGVARFDGVRILGQHGCIAVNSNLKLANLTATALCVPVTHYAKNIQAIEVNSIEENTTYTCPNGYVMSNCYGQNNWTQLGKIEVLIGPNTCMWRKLNGKVRSIKLTFICFEE